MLGLPNISPVRTILAKPYRNKPMKRIVLLEANLLFLKNTVKGAPKMKERDEIVNNRLDLLGGKS
jgi:hypothetical protein